MVESPSSSPVMFLSCSALAFDLLTHARAQAPAPSMPGKRKRDGVMQWRPQPSFYNGYQLLHDYISSWPAPQVGAAATTAVDCGGMHPGAATRTWAGALRSGGPSGVGASTRAIRQQYDSEHYQSSMGQQQRQQTFDTDQRALRSSARVTPPAPDLIAGLPVSAPSELRRYCTNCGADTTAAAATAAVPAPSPSPARTASPPAASYTQRRTPAQCCVPVPQLRYQVESKSAGSHSGAGRVFRVLHEWSEPVMWGDAVALMQSDDEFGQLLTVS
jgi:hypothetical protein